MNNSITLISHPLCPYVQRAAIILMEKQIPFKRMDVDLANKPDWFMNISPLGKTPVLLLDDRAIFESAVICEYLDEVYPPRLHPDGPFARARHRAWMEVGSATLNTIAAFYNAGDERTLRTKAAKLKTHFEHLENELGAGPYFGGQAFTLVDAVYGPVFRYFDVFDTIDNFGIFAEVPKVIAWRMALAGRDSVTRAVSPTYQELLWDFLLKRNSALSHLMQSGTSSTAGTQDYHALHKIESNK